MSRGRISAGWIALRLSLLLGPFLVILLNWPVISLRLREVIVVTSALLVVTTLVAAWRWKWGFGGLVAVYGLVGGFLLLPGGPVDAGVLENTYAARLVAYRGVPYVWGGEGGWGIDCSGLVRRAMEDSLVLTGLRTGNPRAIREGVGLWWDDATAKEMGRGYAGRMKEVTTCESLNGLAEPPLRPGDVAVTKSGGHVMAYVGNHVWAGADPSEQKVTLFTTPGEKNAYFLEPMNIMRWIVLEK